MKGTEKLAHQLLEKIYTTSTLKTVSDTLEKLTQSKNFKNHAHDIVADETLTETQKKTQLMYLIKSVEMPLIYDFFSDALTESSFWMFAGGKIDYFDKFVQAFQMATEEVKVVYLVTAMELPPEDLQAIAIDLGKSFGYQVILNFEVNESIMAGAQIRVENFVFDYSMRTKFRHFSQEWLKSLESTEKKVGFHDFD